MSRSSTAAAAIGIENEGKKNHAWLRQQAMAAFFYMQRKQRLLVDG